MAKPTTEQACIPERGMSAKLSSLRHKLGRKAEQDAAKPSKKDEKKKGDSGKKADAPSPSKD